MAPIPAHVNEKIIRFFNIADSTAPDSGAWMANELFTKDGLFQTHETCIARGHDEIAACRANNSPLITSRSHSIAGIYTSSTSPAADFVVLGCFNLHLVDGNTSTMDFTARFVLRAENDEDKFEFVRVWTDPQNMLDALKEAEKTVGGIGK